MKQYLYEITGSDLPKEARSQLEKCAGSIRPSAVLIHLFCNSGSDNSHIISLIEKIKTILPEARIIGLSTGGEIIQSDLTVPCILMSLFMFRNTHVRIMCFQDIVFGEKEAGKKIAAVLNRCADAKGVELLLAGRKIESAPIYEELKKCRDNLTFFGGYAVEHEPDKGPAFLVTADGILENSLAAVIYSGKDLHIDAGRTTGWKPLGKSFRVTGANERRLYTINGIPAYDLYNRFLKFPDDESFVSYAREFPLMLKKGKMRLLRHPQEKYSDSSILLDGRVKGGDEICLSYGAPFEIIRRINMRCEKIRDFEPEAILLYSCIGRKNFWGELIEWEMQPFQKLAETGGACIDGQIMRNFQTGRVIEHRLTLLSIAMREGKKTGRSLEKIEVDDEILKGRMSLVHRMSTLIESMMEELQETNDILLGMNERLARANEELQKIAVTDELTGLYNRREIERRIREALEKTKASHHPITLVMLDIDFFKKVNDTYGHEIGDKVLKEISDILRKYTDETHEEAVGRWGGEEFFILLPDKNMEEALMLAEKIRKAVELHDFSTAKHLTVSMGVTCADAETNYQAIFIRTDQALYQAKQGGRNRVIEAKSD